LNLINYIYMLNAIKVLLGIILGFVTLGLLGTSAVYYFMVTNLSAKPTKPAFAEERNPKKAAKPVVKKTPAVPKPAPEVAKEEKKEEKAIPPGAYGATVMWETGVSLRQEASDSSAKVGGVGFREKIIVLQENADKSWVKVRNSDNTAEGWLKAGNVERDAAAAN
jgi:Bacterial SH3 domain